MTKTAQLFGAAALLAAVSIGTPAQAQVMPPAQYVAVAGASDLFEETASKLVLQTTRDPAVRSFATAMVADHGKSTDKVKTAAASAQVAATPPKLNAVQAELIAQLRAETGPARDAAYLAQQRASHGQALAVQQAYAAEGTAAPLKAAAAEIVPVVQDHIKMLMAM